MNNFEKKKSPVKLKINKNWVYLKILLLSIFIPFIVYVFIDLTTQYINNITISMNGYIPTIAHKKTLYLITSPSKNKKPREITFGLLFILLIILMGAIFNLIKFLYLARRGYVVFIQPKGLLLANGDFIEWNNIQNIIYHKKTYGKYTGRPERISIQKKSWHEIILSNFALPTREAHRILIKFLHDHRPCMKHTR